MQKRSTPRHIIIKLLEAKDRDNLKSSRREAKCHIQEMVNKINREFLVRNHGDQKGVR